MIAWMKVGGPLETLISMEITQQTDLVLAEGNYGQHLLCNNECKRDSQRSAD